MKRSAAPSVTGKRSRGWNPPRRSYTPVVKRNNWQPRFDTVPRGIGTVVGTTTGFPRILKFKHKYAGGYTISGSGTQGRRVRANNIYDPDAAIGGKQPLYFDQLSAIYNHFTVTESKIIIRVIPTPNTVEDAYQIVLWVNDDETNTPTDLENRLEQTGGQTRLCSALNPSVITMSTSWSLWERFRGRVGESRFTGNASAGPTEQSFYQVDVRAVDGGISNVSVYLQVEVEYTTYWTELKDIAAST